MTPCSLVYRWQRMNVCAAFICKVVYSEEVSSVSLRNIRAYDRRFYIPEPFNLRTSVITLNLTVMDKC
jgi:hypothetical protein